MRLSKKFSSEAMTQDEAWKKNYDEVMSFITENGRNLSKYNLEERRLQGNTEVRIQGKTNLRIYGGLIIR